MDLILVEKRKAAGLKQAEFAQAIGAKPATVSNWENGWADPPIKFLPTIARVLGCSIDDLFPKEAGDDKSC